MGLNLLNTERQTRTMMLNSTMFSVLAILAGVSAMEIPSPDQAPPKRAQAPPKPLKPSPEKPSIENRLKHLEESIVVGGFEIPDYTTSATCPVCTKGYKYQTDKQHRKWWRNIIFNDYLRVDNKDGIHLRRSSIKGRDHRCKMLEKILDKPQQFQLSTKEEMEDMRINEKECF